MQPWAGPTDQLPTAWGALARAHSTFSTAELSCLPRSLSVVLNDFDTGPW